MADNPYQPPGDPPGYPCDSPSANGEIPPPDISRTTDARVKWGGYLRFVLFNSTMVLFILALFFHKDRWETLVAPATIAVIVIIGQYPLLVYMSRWRYRLLVFYGSMALFLFLLGVAWSWNWAVGSAPPGSWSARLDGGLRMMLMGHIFGGWAFPVIVAANRMLQRILF